jgi:aspartate racemase
MGAGLVPVWPEDEGPVLALIRQVKAGDTGPAAHAAMADLGAEMAGRCDHFLVACTELSLLTGALGGGFTDSLDCLVTAICTFARG